MSLIRATPIEPKPTDGEERAEDGTNPLGIIYMAAGFFVFAAVDTQAKFLTETLPPLQVVWSRQLGLLLGVVVLLLIKGVSILKTDHPGLQVARGVCAAMSASCFIIAVSFVPLADAIAVSFVAPFFVTILAAYVLREHVGIRRWTAVAIGFVATLIVIRPGMGVVHPAVLIVVLAALLFAIRQIISRHLSRSDTTLTTIAYTSLVGSAVLTVPLPFVWTWPTTGLELGLLVGLATLAALGEFLIIRALELTNAVVLAPLQYTMIVWGTMYGFLVFGDFPDFFTIIGTTIIIVSGAYTIHRERVVAKRRRMANT